MTLTITKEVTLPLSFKSMDMVVIHAIENGKVERTFKCFEKNKKESSLFELTSRVNDFGQLEIVKSSIGKIKLGQHAKWDLYSEMAQVIFEEATYRELQEKSIILLPHPSLSEWYKQLGPKDFSIEILKDENQKNFIKISLAENPYFKNRMEEKPIIKPDLFSEIREEEAKLIEILKPQQSWFERVYSYLADLLTSYWNSIINCFSVN